MTVYSGNLQESFSGTDVPSSLVGNPPSVFGAVVDLGAITTEYLLYAFTSAGNATVEWQGSVDDAHWYSLPVASGGVLVTEGSIPARYIQAFARETSTDSTVSALVAAIEE